MKRGGRCRFRTGPRAGGVPGGFAGEPKRGRGRSGRQAETGRAAHFPEAFSAKPGAGTVPTTVHRIPEFAVRYPLRPRLEAKSFSHQQSRCFCPSKPWEQKRGSPSQKKRLPPVSGRILGAFICPNRVWKRSCRLSRNFSRSAARCSPSMTRTGTRIVFAGSK